MLKHTHKYISKAVLKTVSPKSESFSKEGLSKEKTAVYHKYNISCEIKNSQNMMINIQWVSNPLETVFAV